MKRLDGCTEVIMTCLQANDTTRIYLDEEVKNRTARASNVSYS